MENQDEKAPLNYVQPLKELAHLIRNATFWRLISISPLRYALNTARNSGQRLGNHMEWTAPAFEEICLNCEINSYASAQL